MKVLLASSSPFRRDIFKSHFPALYLSDQQSFLSPDIDEKAVRHKIPEQMVLAIARAKMEATAVMKGAMDVGADLVLTCDQITVCKGNVREKPENKQEAKLYLSSYAQGVEVECLNGLVLLHVPSGRKIEAVDRSTISFGNITEKEIEKLVTEDDMCMRTAGGFSVGHNSVLARRIKTLRGTVSSIEGFPHVKIKEMLLELCPDLPCQLPILGKIKCVLFDMDGLLLDTESAYTVASDKILSRFGIKFSYEVKSMMMGRKALQAAQVMIKHYGLQDQLKAEDFVTEREKILDELFPKADMMAGVERLLTHLKKLKVPMAIATSSHKRHFDMKTHRHIGYFNQIFDAVVTGDMVTRSKPEPEIFQMAFRKLELQRDILPEEVLVFEDAPLGIEAAIAAKMKSVLVSEMAPRNSLGMDLHIKSMANFLPEQWGFPPFDDHFQSKLVE